MNLRHAFSAMLAYWGMIHAAQADPPGTSSPAEAADADDPVIAELVVPYDAPSKDPRVHAIVSDRRVPCAADLSGVWKSVGGSLNETIQIEQRGESVSGRGYWSLCIPTHPSHFTFQGTLRDGQLALTVVEAFSEPTAGVRFTLRVVPERPLRLEPQFRASLHQGGTAFEPAHGPPSESTR